MAKKTETLVTLTDDLDGSKAERTVTFAVNGSNYEIELSKKNATAFEKAIKPYVDAARKTRGAGTSRARTNGESNGRRSRSRNELGQIREWARSNGLEVSARGRISAAVQNAYDTAH